MSLFEVTPALVGMVLWYVLSEGQMDSSMMSMQEAPIYVLILRAQAGFVRTLASIAKSAFRK